MSEGQETIFNSAKASLERLHELLVAVNIYSTSCYQDNIPQPNMLDNWMHTLKAIEKEIDPKLSETNRKELLRLFSKFRVAGSFRIITNTPEGNIYTINQKNYNRTISLCHVIEKQLRRMADRHGMLIPTKPGAFDAIAEME